MGGNEKIPIQIYIYAHLKYSFESILHGEQTSVHR